MSFNTFGKIFRFTTWGESHGPAIGCVVDGCPPNISLKFPIIGTRNDSRPFKRSFFKLSDFISMSKNWFCRSFAFAIPCA